MSDFDDNTRPASPAQQFDLLVDGELSEADRRALLLQLEHEPDGWRRCALAFLEAQCWRAELGQMDAHMSEERGQRSEVRDQKPEISDQTDLRPPTSDLRPLTSGLRWQSWRQLAATFLSIGASFLIALVVGMRLSGSAGYQGNWSGLAHSSGSSHVTPAIGKLPLENPGDELVPLQLDGASGGQLETVLVPAQPRNTLDQDMLENLPDAIPPELRQAIERGGHRVVSQREVVSRQMKDGRRLVVPVDHVQIHFVSRPSL